jgi:hypothetical protein
MARLLLITEPNLYQAHDAYLPPPWCNLGTARLAGHCREEGHDVRLFSFYPELLAALLDQPAGRSWVVQKVTEAVPALRGLVDRHGTHGAATALRALSGQTRLPSREAFLDSGRVGALGLLLGEVWQLAETHLDDPNHPLYGSLDAAVTAANPDWVGVSMTRWGEPVVETVVRHLASRGLPVIIGGSAATHLEADQQAHLLNGLGAHSLVLGPGEFPLTALLAGESTPPNVRQLSAGTVGPQEPLVWSRRNAPCRPAFDLLDLDQFYFPERVLPILLSEGCYWKRCAYCRREVCRDAWHAADPAAVANEVVRLAHSFNVRTFSLNDLAIPPPQARAFARALRAHPRRPENLTFFGAARPERRFTASLLEELADVGFRALFWGVESGSSQVLRRMGKGTSPSTIERVLGDAHRAGILNLCFFMVGFPGETEAQWRETLSLWDRTAPFIAYNRLNPFVLEPGSAVFDDPKRFGVTIGSRHVGGDSWSYSAARGADADEARARKAALLAEVANGHRRITNGELQTIKLPGDGDEPLPFCVAQHLP